MSLDLNGRRVVVVGGGAVGTRRAGDLLAAGARVKVVAPSLSETLRAWMTEGLIAAARRPFRPADVEKAWLVVAATDDPAVNRAVMATAKARRCFASSADGAAASFRPMAVLRRGDVEVAVGTGGRSPGFAAGLRRRLEAELGPEYGILLELMAEIRDQGRVRREADWCAMFDPGILDAIRTGRLDDAREGLRACRSSLSG